MPNLKWKMENDYDSEIFRKRVTVISASQQDDEGFSVVRTHSRAALPAQPCFRAGRHHLSRSLVHFCGDVADGRRVQSRARSERLGLQRVYTRLRRVRNSGRLAGRSLRGPTDVD